MVLAAAKMEVMSWSQQENETNSECNDEIDGDEQVEIREDHKDTSYEVEGNKGTNSVLFPKSYRVRINPQFVNQDTTSEIAHKKAIKELMDTSSR